MLFYLRKLVCYISLFFFRGALSDRNIKKLLGYHIFIYPFKEENLKPSSYNLTASKFAFIKEKENGEEKQKLIIKDNEIIIPPHQTAIIETEESIYVSRWITGTYHSRVKMVNKGLGHIGTTLDPCFFGVSAIAMTNHTDKDVKIKVGEPIVTLMFYSLKSRCKGMHDNMTARIDTNINLDCEDFFDFKDSDNKIVVIQKEELCDKLLEMKLKDLLSNDLSSKCGITLLDNEDYCDRCQDCSNKDGCISKFIKYHNYKNQKIIDEIKEWKSQPYIHTKQALIEKVREQIRIDNTSKDIFLYSLFFILVGIFSIYRLFKFSISKNYIPGSIEIALIQAIMAITIPTVVAIIGIIANYKTKYKEEHKE